ncbi:hypothetical protein PAPYR_6136 [Paratrimastix pyriformis]|uniref:C3H1-type domain-containing protein n=1 Tax=Paratrimastix pyriformis TaxID=342808 RepID=A0ABQ8UJQ6_9EUKA|nr:hypothetical protein PAPYR_6136 [Paratrimastix pyriformis]
MPRNTTTKRSPVTAPIRSQPPISFLASQHVFPPLASGEPKRRTLYKTELCRNYMELGHCEYGDKCEFAHGLDDLIATGPRHPCYRTRPCHSFHSPEMVCYYGTRCRFQHAAPQPEEAQVVALSSLVTTAASALTPGGRLPIFERFSSPTPSDPGMLSSAVEPLVLEAAPSPFLCHSPVDAIGCGGPVVPAVDHCLEKDCLLVSGQVGRRDPLGTPSVDCDVLAEVTQVAPTHIIHHHQTPLACTE